MKISIVIPILNEEESLRELIPLIVSVLEPITSEFEIVAVDDGSTDGTYALLSQLRQNDPRLKIIRFRRNFGKSDALAAGFDVVTGDVVFTMDADLQDDPREIPKFLDMLEEGYDLISGWKKVRHDPISKTVPSRFFNRVTSHFSGVRLHDFNCGFKCYRREVIEEVQVYGELHRFIPALAASRGFRVGEMVVQHHARRFGVTKFGLNRFFNGFVDLLTVVFLSRYTRKPLHLFGLWGSLFGLVGSAVLGYLTVWKLTGHALGNRPILFYGVLALIVGVQLFSIGLLGEMITSTNSRPTFSIKSKELD